MSGQHLFSKQMALQIHMENEDETTKANPMVVLSNEESNDILSFHSMKPPRDWRWMFHLHALFGFEEPFVGDFGIGRRIN